MAASIQGDIMLSLCDFTRQEECERAVWDELRKRGVPVRQTISGSHVAKGRLSWHRDILTDAVHFEWTEE